MLEWQEFISQILTYHSSIDGISLSFDESGKAFEVPPIIKASVLMLDKMIQNQGPFNILVFPERIQSIFIFSIVKLLYNISEKRIKHTYDPSTFKKGDRLRFESAIVEFDSITVVNGKMRMKIRLAEELTVSAPFDYFPLFQLSHTKKKLSTFKQYNAAIILAKQKLAEMSSEQQNVKLLADYKTHMDSSIINMTSIINTKQLISGCKICGQNLKDAVLIGQADFEGKINNIGAGQLIGIPAIVLASDLYAISAVAENNHPIQSIIIDASNATALASQLPELDNLMRLGVPITCVTDAVNSFDLQPFLERGFNLWRWDEASITEKLYDVSPLLSDIKTKHYAKREVKYLITDGNEISEAIKLLYRHRKESYTASAQTLKLYDTLFSIAFKALHETIPFSDIECTHTTDALVECDRLLIGERPYLSPTTFDGLETIINRLKSVFTFGASLPKYNALADKLMTIRAQSIALVVPERSDKSTIQNYWQSSCDSLELGNEIEVLYPAEYCSVACDKYDLTIVVGWLKRAIMRKILFSFNTQRYCVLLYDYEKRWKNYDTYNWDSVLSKGESKKTVEKSFSAGEIKISTERFASTVQKPPEIPKADEQAEIDTLLREIKYHQYVAGGGKRLSSETIEAIPVNYVGGYLAFYRTGHKLVSASNIIENDADKIETKLPKELKLGEFVVVREVDRDLVKEMADIILEQSGMTDKRAIASKWKEALEIESLFYTPEQIYERLQEVGCRRSLATIRTWLTDDDMIAPQSKDDLEYIAKMTNNDVLKEMINQVFDAAQTVKAAHSKAGMALSHQLRSRIVEELKEYGDIDPFNIWQPIEMVVDGIGMVRILKITDIGAPVVVDITDTNRLIEEG